MNKIKYKSAFLFGVVGGMIGVIFHLVWHYENNIKLFNYSSHIMSGIAYTIIGVIVGIFIWYLLNLKQTIYISLNKQGNKVLDMVEKYLIIKTK